MRFLMNALMTIDEVAAYMQVSRFTVYRLDARHAPGNVSPAEAHARATAAPQVLTGQPVDEGLGDEGPGDERQMESANAAP